MPLTSPDSEEALANLALGKCHTDEIAGFDDNLKRARVARRHFPLIRDALLRELDWNFASTWVTPAAAEDVTFGEWTYLYPLPGDCLAVREVRDLDEDAWEVTTQTYTDAAGAEVEAMMLATDAEAADVRYTRRVETVRLWDALFKRAFVCLLAGAMAPELGRSDQMAMALTSEGENLYAPKAKRADSKEKAKSKVSHNRVVPWLAARSGVRRGY